MGDITRVVKDRGLVHLGSGVAPLERWCTPEGTSARTVGVRLGALVTIGWLGLIFTSIGAISPWFVFLGLVAAWFSMRQWRWPLTVGSLWFHGIQLELGPMTIRLSQVGAVLLLILAMSYAGTAGRAWSRRTSRLVLLGAGWLIVELLSSIAFAPVPMASLWVWSQALLGCVLFLAISELDDDAKAAISRVSVLVGASTVMMSLIFAAWGFALGIDRHDVPGFSSDGRLVGFSFEPNILASSAVMWIVVVICARGWFSTWERWSVVPLLIGVVLSGTRAGWIALAVVGASYALLVRGLLQRHLRLIVGSAAGLLIAWIVAAVAFWNTREDSITWRIAHILDLRSATAGYRLDIYRTAISDLDRYDAWAVGLGTNSFSQRHLIDATSTGPAYLSSLFIALLYAGGVIGLMFFVAMKVELVRGSGRRLFTLLTVTAFIVCSLTTSVLWFSFVYVALAVSIPRSSPALEAARIRPGTRWVDKSIRRAAPRR